MKQSCPGLLLLVGFGLLIQSFPYYRATEIVVIIVLMRQVVKIWVILRIPPFCPDSLIVNKIVSSIVL